MNDHTKPIDICFAINDTYVEPLMVTLYSLLRSNDGVTFRFHVIGNNLSDAGQTRLKRFLAKFSHVCIEFVNVNLERFQLLKTTIDYITIETYFRYVLAELFPELNKILYLDADLVVVNDITELWNTELGTNYAAGVNDTYIEKICYKKEIGFEESELYVNAGVILFNLETIRRDNIISKLFEQTGRFRFQDQDVINVVFRKKTVRLPDKFNVLYDRGKNNLATASIIHYTGERKPWIPKHNKLRFFQFKYWRVIRKNENIYRKWRSEMLQWEAKKIRVALLIDEYFGALGTAYGGYGMLARHYIAKYLPNEEIEVEVLLKRQNGTFRHPFAKKHLVDGVVVYRPPSAFWCPQWLEHQNYDVYLGIEVTHDLLQFEKSWQKRRLIHWIQDPTTSRDWGEVSTMNFFVEPSYWNSALYDLVNRLYQSDRVRFITQGYCLNEKAKDLYRLRHDVSIEYVPNPVEIDYDFSVDAHEKKNMILFLGRIESVKRGWLFCEIAKRMPEYDFYMLGQTFRHSEKNEKIVGPYRQGIPNLHFVGHVEGEQKARYLKDAKILVNTSIREGIPISYLEALAYGTLLVSGFNAEDLPEKFGVYVGKVLGDGFDKIDLFVDGIRKIMSDEEQRKETARKAVAYIKEHHSIKQFQDTMRAIVKEEAQKRHVA